MGGMVDFLSKILTIGGGGVTTATTSSSEFPLELEGLSVLCLEFPLCVDDLVVFLLGPGDVKGVGCCVLPSGFALWLGDVLSADVLPPELLPF